MGTRTEWALLLVMARCAQYGDAQTGLYGPMILPLPRAIAWHTTHGSRYRSSVAQAVALACIMGLATRAAVALVKRPSVEDSLEKLDIRDG